MPELPFAGVLGKLVKFVLKKATGVELPERGKDWYDTITLSSEQALGGADKECRTQNLPEWFVSRWCPLWPHYPLQEGASKW